MCCSLNIQGRRFYICPYCVLCFNRPHILCRLIIEVPVCSINCQSPTICIRTIYAPSTLSRSHSAVFFSGELGCRNIRGGGRRWWMRCVVVLRRPSCASLVPGHFGVLPSNIDPNKGVYLYHRLWLSAGGYAWPYMLYILTISSLLTHSY